MKKIVILLFFILYFICGYSQIWLHENCTDFDSNIHFIQIDTSQQNVWQIGIPNKLTLDSSYTANNCIITDTINYYPVNNISSFIAVLGPPIFDYLMYYGDFQLAFNHRFQIDSLTDYGIIEMSIDGGNSWINGMSNLFTMSFDSSENSHYFESTDTCCYDSIPITGSSNGWIRSIITKDVNDWNLSTGLSLIDSIIVRFTFISDSINNNKDGWQIDDLCLRYRLLGVGFDEKTYFDASTQIYPNPSNKNFNVELDLPKKSKAEIRIVNIIGQTKATIPIKTNKTIINTKGWQNGIYVCNLFVDGKLVKSEKLVLQ